MFKSTRVGSVSTEGGPIEVGRQREKGRERVEDGRGERGRGERDGEWKMEEERDKGREIDRNREGDRRRE